MLKPISRHEAPGFNDIAIYETYEGYYEGIVFNIRQYIICGDNGNTQSINGVIHVMSVSKDSAPNLFGTNIQLSRNCHYSFDRQFSFNNNNNRDSEMYIVAKTLITKGIPNTEVGKVLYG